MVCGAFAWESSQKSRGREGVPEGAEENTKSVAVRATDSQSVGIQGEGVVGKVET